MLSNKLYIKLQSTGRSIMNNFYIKTYFSNLNCIIIVPEVKPKIAIAEEKIKTFWRIMLWVYYKTSLFRTEKYGQSFLQS